MRPISLLCLTTSALLIYTPLQAAPVHDWSRRAGGTGINIAEDVAVDGSGNVIVAGSFAGTMTIGSVMLTSAGSRDILLAKFDADGAYVWSQRFGGIGPDVAHAVAADAAGNITLTGYFRGPVSFGGDPLPGRGAQDIFVARFDPDGVHQWSRWYGTSGDDEGQDVVTDAAGNAFVAGQYNGAIDFGGGPAAVFGSLDAFVLKLDATGAYQWSRTAGNANPDVAYGVALDTSGNVFATGSFSGSVNFGGGAMVSGGSTDVFLVKYDGSGAQQWSTRLGGPAADAGYGVGADAGGVFITGSYDGAFLARYDTDGARQWNENFSSSGFVQGLDLAVSPAGTVAITGNLQGTASFGGDLLTSAGDDDIFLALCDGTGGHLWSRRFGSSGDDWGYGCAFDATGNLIGTGLFNASVDFGGGSLVSAGLSDVYVVKFEDEVVVVDTTPPSITCPAPVEVEQTTAGGAPATDGAIAAFLAGATASDDTDPSPVITNDGPAVYPVGTTVVTFRATDASGNMNECTSSVTVRDATAPQIQVVLDKTLLWPPNHKMVTVCARVVAQDDGGAEPSLSLVSITCDECEDGRGDGHTNPDIQNAEFGTPDLCFDLRAERAGNGDGRIYEITYAVTDASGNTATATAQVRVPHDNDEVLTSVHPNPFNPQATLEYTLVRSDRVRIAIYDARGALVRRLFDATMPAGDHSLVWTGRDDSGVPVGSGIYFVKVTAGSRVETRKIVMLK